MHMTMGDGSPFIATELPWMLAYHAWVCVFGSSVVFGSLGRIPPKDHILRILDAVKTYAYSERHYCEINSNTTPPESLRRGPLFERFHGLIAVWEPPDLTDEIVQAARALFEEESGGPPNGGWEQWGQGIGDIGEELIWPEQIPEIITASQNAEADISEAVRSIQQHSTKE